MNKPTPALIVATLALAVALTGTAGAAGLIDGHSIRNHSITANKLAKGAVTAPAVRDHAITKSALADGVIVNNTVIAPAGPAGKDGATGATGAPGAPGVNVSSVEQVIVSTTTGSAVAACPVGKDIIGGGYWASGSTVIVESHPDTAVQGWKVSTGGPVATFTVYAICARTAA